MRELIKSITDGELHRYAEIINTYQQEVWRIMVLSAQDFHATEVLVQDVFIRVYNNLEKYDSDKDFGVWLRTIARNCLRNELKRISREQKNMRQYAEYMEICISRDKGNEGNTCIRQALKNCREKLAPHAREVLTMRYEKNFSFEAIAEKLGRTLPACRQMLTRIRLTLRGCIQNQRKQYE